MMPSTTTQNTSLTPSATALMRGDVRGMCSVVMRRAPPLRTVPCADFNPGSASTPLDAPEAAGVSSSLRMPAQPERMTTSRQRTVGSPAGLAVLALALAARLAALAATSGYVPIHDDRA